jgi:hypothetical protein
MAALGITAAVLLALHRDWFDIPYTARKTAGETADWLLAVTWCAVVLAKKL